MKRPKRAKGLIIHLTTIEYIKTMDKYCDCLEETNEKQSKIIDYVHKFAPTSFLKELKQALK